MSQADARSMKKQKKQHDFIKRSRGEKIFNVCNLVLMAVLLGLNAAGLGELASGLAAIAAVGVYYLFLWLFRDRLRNEYVFTIER